MIFSGINFIFEEGITSYNNFLFINYSAYIHMENIKLIFKETMNKPLENISSFYFYKVFYFITIHDTSKLVVKNFQCHNTS